MSTRAPNAEVDSPVARAMRRPMERAAAGAITLEEAIAQAVRDGLAALTESTEADRKAEENRLLLLKHAEHVARGDAKGAVAKSARYVSGGCPQRRPTLERRLRRLLA